MKPAALVARCCFTANAALRLRWFALLPGLRLAIAEQRTAMKNWPSCVAPSSRRRVRCLNVAHGEVLDYPDSKLDRTDLYRVVCDLVLRIRQLRPHVIVTFGPDGGLTGHVDHAIAGTFATLAFEWAGRPDRYPEQLGRGLTPHRALKLYYLAADFLLDDRQPIAPPTITTRIEIGKERFEKKHFAFRQHTTQKPLFEKVRKNFSQR